MEQCLESVLGSNVDDIKVTPDSFFASLHGSNTAATTRKNAIYLNIGCDDFLNDSDLVLHEYYHVVHQWNTGRLTTWRYIKESMENGYWNNKYEIEARNFANNNLKDFEDCVQCCENPECCE